MSKPEYIEVTYNIVFYSMIPEGAKRVLVFYLCVTHV